MVRHVTKQSSGFTLIELIIGIVILIVLAAIMVNTYQTFVVRAQVTDGLALADSLKESVHKHLQEHGDLPVNRVEAGLSSDATESSNNYVKSIAVTNGRLDITFGNDANPTIADAVLTVTPEIQPENTLTWYCGQTAVTTVPERYQPGFCR
jgi:type IV pilus assembly protein PilA